MLRPLYPPEWSGTHCTESWVGPRAGLGGVENLIPTEIRSPDHAACDESLYRLQINMVRYIHVCRPYCTGQTLMGQISNCESQVNLQDTKPTTETCIYRRRSNRQYKRRLMRFRVWCWTDLTTFWLRQDDRRSDVMSHDGVALENLMIRYLKIDVSQWA